MRPVPVFQDYLVKLVISAGPNGVILSETTSGGEAGACLQAFCCGTFFLWLLSIVLSATKFESPVASTVSDSNSLAGDSNDRQLVGIANSTSAQAVVAARRPPHVMDCFEPPHVMDWRSYTMASGNVFRAAAENNKLETRTPIAGCP